MGHRVSLRAALALIAPIIAVVLVALVVARPPAAAPDPAAGAPARPQQPEAGRGPAASAANSAPPQAAPTAAPAPQRASGPAAPGFDGGGAWINSEPLTLADLKGKVVLVDFWAYSCYNCINTLPYLKQWWATYKDQGLVIVGVHTPEFESEKDLANLQPAVRSNGIAWPVVQDNDKQIWRAYGNHYWPHFYLIDDRGQIIYDHIGEGSYDETERQIGAALAAAKAE